MDTQTIRDRLAEAEREMQRAEEERAAFGRVVTDLKYLLSVRGGDSTSPAQARLPIPDRPQRGGPPLGEVSYRNGLIQVLKEAKGKWLEADEIWARMENLGVASRAENPKRFIPLTVGRIGAEVVRDGTKYSWVGGRKK